MSERCDSLRSILMGIANNELLHIQKVYHGGPIYRKPKNTAPCKTGHCVAGWRNMFEYCDKFGVKDPDHVTVGSVRYQQWLQNTVEVDGDDDYEFCLAQQRWDLTEAQGERLMNGTATYEDQFAVLNEIEFEDGVELTPMPEHLMGK